MTTGRLICPVCTGAFFNLKYHTSLRHGLKLDEGAIKSAKPEERRRAERRKGGVK